MVTSDNHDDWKDAFSFIKKTFESEQNDAILQ